MNKLIEPVPIFNSYGKSYIEIDEFRYKESKIIEPLIGIHHFKCEDLFVIYTPNEKYNEKGFESYVLAEKYLLKSLEEL